VDASCCGFDARFRCFSHSEAAGGIAARPLDVSNRLEDTGGLVADWPFVGSRN